MMRNQNIDDIYRERRERAKEQRRQRQEILYRAVPEVEELDRQVALLGSQGALAMPDAREREALAQTLAQLKQARAQLLEKAGYPEDYTAIHYQCSLCQDTGRVEGRGRCACFDELITHRELEDSNLMGVLQRENFERFDLNLFSDEPIEGYEHSPRERMRRYRSWAEGYVEKYPDVRHALLYGYVGTGKTFLLNSMAKAFLDRHVQVVYYSAQELMEVMGNHHFEKNPGSDDSQRYERMKNADVLIIDDLGTELINSFTQSALFHLINYRTMTQKPMLISTNLGLAEIKATYTERILSRIIQHFQLLECYGPDVRYRVNIKEKG